MLPMSVKFNVKCKRLKFFFTTYQTSKLTKLYFKVGLNTKLNMVKKYIFIQKEPGKNRKVRRYLSFLYQMSVA